MIDGLILEFGVMDGMSMRQLCKRFPGRTVYGFDSFLGLREKWCKHKAGEFASSIPRKLPPNARLVIGWIEDTLPKFLKDHPANVAFVHVDIDTYSTAKFILESIKERLISKSVILFDEYWNYPGYENYEYRAWWEFVIANPGIQVSQSPDHLDIIRRRFRDYPLGRLLHPARVVRSLLRRLFNRQKPQMAFCIEREPCPSQPVSLCNSLKYD